MNDGPAHGHVQPAQTHDGPYRALASPRRQFIATEISAQEADTRHLFSAASTADLAVVLVDAREGLLPLTRRYTILISLLGVRKVVLAVDKMDLVGCEQATFDRLVDDFRRLADALELSDVQAMPVVVAAGDNLVRPSERMPWYAGPTLLQHLETVDIGASEFAAGPLRLCVQTTGRADRGSPSLTGTLISGNVGVGDAVCILPSRQTSRIARIIGPSGDLTRARAQQPVTVHLADPVAVAPGDLICGEAQAAEVASQFQATVFWMDSEPLLRGRSYELHIETTRALATVMPIRHRIDIQTLAAVPAERLERNEIGEVELELDRSVAFDPYRDNHNTGGFTLIDRESGRTVGAGLLHFALRRSDNLRWQDLDVDRAARRLLNGHGSALVWLTGLSGSGKSTIANQLARSLHARGVRTYVLDGDNVRHGLNKDLGFTAQDRVENIRRVAEVAKLMVDAGLVVITALISPFRAERRMARSLLAPGEFFEVHVDVPLAVAESRDPKGLYRKARSGQLKNFTGIDSPYERPDEPEVVLDTAAMTAAEAAEKVLCRLVAAGVLDAESTR